MNCRKLIACDIDGTLLSYGETTLSGEIFELIRELQRAGICFCTASGRQYHSLRKLFEPVADEIAYLCENGAVVLGRGSEENSLLFSSVEIPKKDALAIAQDVLSFPNCEVLLSARNCYYVCSTSEDFLKYLEVDNGALVKKVDDLEKVSEKIFKVSMINRRGEIQVPQKVLSEKWKDYYVTISGEVWVDIALADKGSGLRAMCSALGFTLDDCIAFGDNWNDVSMLEVAGTGYLMESADKELLERFPNHCRSVPEILKTLLKKL